MDYCIQDHVLQPEHTGVKAPALGELSESARQFAQAAALVGDLFTLQEIALVQSVPTLSMLAALEETVSAGLIRFAGDRLTFRSPDIRRAFSATIPAPVRRMLLRRSPAPGLGRQPSPEVCGTRDALVSALLLPQDGPGRLLDPCTGETARRAAVEAFSSAGMPRSEASSILSMCGHDEGERRDRARALITARRPGAASVVAAVVLSNLEWAAGRLDEALRWGHEALDRGQEVLPPSWRPYPSLTLAEKLTQIDRFSEAEGELKRASEAAERSGHRRAMAELAVVRGRLLLGAGRTEAAEAALRSGVSLAQRIHAGLPAAHGLSLLSFLSLERGHQGEAADQVWQARMELLDQPGALPSVQHSWADFLVATAGMDARASVDLLVRRYPDLLTSSSLFLRDPGTAARLVRLSRAAGENSLASAVTRRVERLAERNGGHPGFTAAAEHVRGLLHEAPDALEFAAAEHRTPWAAAAAHEDLGILLLARHGRHHGMAHRHLGAAIERYRAIGSRSAVTRVTALLRESRETPDHQEAPRRRETPQRPAGSPVLTAAEDRIAHLVAEGLTNKQVAGRVSCSPHTVNYHLRQIFRKLGVTSRVELARLVD
ncbi:LuxR C-terminal-related transcriptional regulator [Streptomyces cinereoruber]|uniref:LuxR C-terminal-related transcriptional regulator n=1 Tax=Streptomyces cinereoruber TaxID=67260 RepID=UPI0036320EC0